MMKRKENVLYLCLAVMGLLTSCMPLIPAEAPFAVTATPAATATTEIISTDTAVLIRTPGYAGVIFTAETAAEFITWLDEPADTTWTPTADDIAILEAELVPYLQFNESTQLWERLLAYKRQYFGLVRADEKLIYANFFCDAPGIKWEETAVIVEDGGDCYFQVIFNADTNTFVSLSINGES